MYTLGFCTKVKGYTAVGGKRGKGVAISAISEFSFLKTSSKAEPQQLPSVCGTLQEA